MRYAVLSDVHANLPALEAVLARLEAAKPDGLLCLGDCVGYGAQPNECVELLVEHQAVTVRGNHDVAAVESGKEEWFTEGARRCILWTREQLQPRVRDYLSGLPDSLEIDGAQLCHGAPFDPDYYILTAADAGLALAASDRHLVFVGHTHCAEWYTARAGASRPVVSPVPSGGTLVMEPGKRYVVNPGAVGQPRDGNSMAAYAVWDTESATIELHRVPYNVRAAQEEIIRAGLPAMVSARLIVGA